MLNRRFDKPWLSIIIPVYNAEKYLQECLDSILKQTFLNFEVILVDDGSVDGSLTICKEYASKDDRVKYYTKENKGAYQTRIYGAEKAIGEYITFCDADDYYTTKNAFDILHTELLNGDYSAIQFGYSKKYNHLKKNVKPIEKATSVDEKMFIENEYPKLLCSFWDDSHLNTNVCTKVYHKNLLENLPDSNSAERIFWGDDLILNLHLLSTCKKFRIIPDTLYSYRQFSGSTNKFSLKTMEDLDNIKKYQLSYLDKYDGPNKDKIKSILFSEIAGWFFIYVQQALNHLNENEVRVLVESTLQLPRFLKAEQYYVNNAENWEAVNLLRKCDVELYINKANEYSKRQTFKNKVKDILKKIYVSI